MRAIRFLFKMLMMILLIGLVAPAAPIIYSYWKCPFMPYYIAFNPHKTAMMKYRERKAKEAGKPFELHYEPVKLNRIAPALRKAVIIAEDDGFYQHFGIDIDAVKKAYAYNQRKGKVRRGGSTISQQVAKNLWLSPERSLWRKAVEAVLTVRMEITLSKDRIMELYLNSIEWGDGVFGAAAASKYYFKKTPDALSASQAALLAGSIPSPLRTNPKRITGGLAKRQAIILSRLTGAPKEETEEPGMKDSLPSPDMEAPPTASPTPSPDIIAPPLAPDEGT